MCTLLISENVILADISVIQIVESFGKTKKFLSGLDVVHASF